MNPWLQRFLIGWAAGVVTTGAIVKTAKQPHRLKRKKRKKKADGTDEPVQIGALALKDARFPDERALTMGEWRDRVVASGTSVGTRVSSLFQREPPAPVVDDGARTPDEVQHPDGTVERPEKRHAPSKRRGAKRPQATLWESAKESLKQTVKETVADEVKQSPMGSAIETLKEVSAKVKSGATTVASSAATFVKRGIEGNPALGDDGQPTPSVQEREHTDEPRAVTTEAQRNGSGVEAAAEVAAEVALKVNAGIEAVGTWLKGPGAPGDAKRRRTEGTGDVVDAKDAPPAPPAEENDDEAAQ
jgi:hypothetical protein